MPTYLKSELHFDLNNSGFVSLAPYLGCFFIALIAGRVGDFMLQVSTGLAHLTRSERNSQNSCKKNIPKHGDFASRHFLRIVMHQDKCLCSRCISCICFRIVF